MTEKTESHEPYRILIVDDDDSIRDFLADYLTHAGHTCKTASDGLQGLELARQERFDAVITDIVMPNLDGIALTRELLKIHPGLPVMIMTGYAHEYPVSAALAAGATEFMAKPFSIAQITLRFANMMKHASGTNSKT